MQRSRSRIFYACLGLICVWLGSLILRSWKEDQDDASSESKLRLPTFVDSHMVLQREPHQARIWGWAGPRVTVSITLDSSDNFVVKADEGGKWSLDLPPQPASDGHTIVVEDGVSSRITLHDIAFGDVYLCSGQSNMEFTVPYVFDAAREIADSINYPNLRLATVDLVTADIPQDDAPSKVDYTWARSAPDAVNATKLGGSGWGAFSATCYFFGRDLYKSLKGEVPIGLVTSCWGGQKVEAFSSPDALNDETCGGLVPEGKGTHFPESNITEPPFRVEPMQLWNAMIHPLLPMRFTGVVWYQGEANADNPTSYACRFPAMITDWREKFVLPDLSFFYVELAAYSAGKGSESWPFLRAAQRVALHLPNTGTATAIDLSDPPSPAGSIHPRRKQEVGRRLSLSVRAIQYQDPDAIVDYSGPILAGISLGKQASWTTASLSFAPGTASGLHMAGTAACSTCCQDLPFQILQADGKWTRIANVTQTQNDGLLLLSSAGSIYAVRYAWEPRPQCALYNGKGGPDDHSGLPAAPFQWCAYPKSSGDWVPDRCDIPSEAIDLERFSSKKDDSTDY